MTRQTRPRLAAVDRLEEPAARTTAGASPRVDNKLPHACKENARVTWVHGHVRASGVLVDEQHFLPRLAAVDRLEEPTIGLRAKAVPQRGGEHDTRVAWIDHDATDAARFAEPHERPRLAGVGRLV